MRRLNSFFSMFTGQTSFVLDNISIIYIRVMIENITSFQPYVKFVTEVSFTKFNTCILLTKQLIEFITK